MDSIIAAPIHPGCSKPEAKEPGQQLEHGDKIALQATTGKTEAELLLHGIVPMFATGPVALPVPQGSAWYFCIFWIFLGDPGGVTVC